MGVVLRLGSRPSGVKLPINMNLRERWHHNWQGLGLRPQTDVLERLLTRYSEPARFYHTVQHLDECFAHFDRAQSHAAHSAEISLALWFHDAIYDTRAKDSEEQSAAWAVQVLEDSAAAPDIVARVRELVLATRHDAKPVGPDAALLVDIDLAILGAAQARFDEYETQVRREYSWVPEQDFCAGRGRVLQQFLQRETIYSTELFRAWFEANARNNLARSLKRLASQTAR